MANYWLYNNKYYNPSDGTETTPSETFTSSIKNLEDTVEHKPLMYKSDWEVYATCQSMKFYYNHTLIRTEYFDTNVENDVEYDTNFIV